MTQQFLVVGAEGLAALGICESLLLELTDLAILSEKGARDILSSVGATHSHYRGRYSFHHDRR